MLNQTILKYCFKIATFKHVFESCRHSPSLLYILVCYSVTSLTNLDYHTPFERGYLDLLYGPNSLGISGVIRELELGETFKWSMPRTFDFDALVRWCKRDIIWFHILLPRYERVAFRGHFGKLKLSKHGVDFSNRFSSLSLNQHAA